MLDQSRASFILSQQINQVLALLGIAHGFGEVYHLRLRQFCDFGSPFFAEGVFLSVTPSAVNVLQTVLCDGLHAEGVPLKNTPSAKTPHTFRAEGRFSIIIVTLTSK